MSTQFCWPVCYKVIASHVCVCTRYEALPYRKKKGCCCLLRWSLYLAKRPLLPRSSEDHRLLLLTQVIFWHMPPGTIKFLNTWKRRFTRARTDSIFLGQEAAANLLQALSRPSSCIALTRFFLRTYSFSWKNIGRSILAYKKISPQNSNHHHTSAFATQRFLSNKKVLSGFDMREKTGLLVLA